MQFSRFAERFSHEAGILRLMDDLGKAIHGEQPMLMLGGGNPGQVPAVQDALHEVMRGIMATPGGLEHMLGDYAGQQGEQAFLDAFAGLLREQYGWAVGPENIALTNGSQNAFFFLFNLFGGEYADGSRKQVLLPLAPEYIGYADVSLSPNALRAQRAAFEYPAPHTFKYRIDFEHLEIRPDTAALCVSRPTNPSGNVLSDGEIRQLQARAKQHGIPLIVDSAYGFPFPGIIFSEVGLDWDDNMILCMSLSKFGLPAVRNGIIIAAPEVIEAVSSINAIISLAPASIGSHIALQLIRQNKLLSLSREAVQPFYQAKAQQAVAYLHEYLDDDLPYFVHKAEGAFFLWLWLKNMPISAETLYQRLKQRGVLVVPGHYFFPGLEQDDWRHKQECIRISYARDEATVREGIRIIAEEVRQAYG